MTTKPISIHELLEGNPSDCELQEHIAAQENWAADYSALRQELQALTGIRGFSSLN